MQVLDHEQHGRLPRQAVEHRQQRFEHARLVARAAHPLRSLAEPGQQRRELRADAGGQLREHRIGVAHERAQRGDERRVRQLALAQLDAFAAQHARAVSRRARLELGHQPALADTRLADDERQRRATRRRFGERRLELGQLERAPDETGR